MSTQFGTGKFARVPSGVACQRPGCGHVLRGNRAEGHFNGGLGPCKAKDCECPAFILDTLTIQA